MKRTNLFSGKRMHRTTTHDTLPRECNTQASLIMIYSALPGKNTLSLKKKKKEKGKIKI